MIKSSWTCSLGPGSAGPNLNFPVHVTPRADGRRFFFAGLWPTPIKSCQSLMETPRVTHLADVEGKPSRGFPPSPADWLAELWRKAGKMLPHAIPSTFPWNERMKKSLSDFKDATSCRKCQANQPTAGGTRRTGDNHNHHFSGADALDDARPQGNLDDI